VSGNFLLALTKVTIDVVFDHCFFFGVLFHIQTPSLISKKKKKLSHESADVTELG